MKEIKSNPSKIISTYIIPKDEEIMVSSIAGVKNVKLTEIQIMDRQSNGSFIVKDRINGTALVAKMISEKTVPVKEEAAIVAPINAVIEDKEYKTLKNIDEKMNEIELQLDDIEEK